MPPDDSDPKYSQVRSPACQVCAFCVIIVHIKERGLETDTTETDIPYAGTMKRWQVVVDCLSYCSDPTGSVLICTIQVDRYMGETIVVGMAEMRVSRAAEDELLALGLGSCVCVCLFDPQTRAAGMARIILPDSAGHNPGPYKFVDTAIPLLILEMELIGADSQRLRAALVGGAQLFAFNGSGPRIEIGSRNAAAAHAALDRHRIALAGAVVGGAMGRSVRLAGDGTVRVTTVGRSESETIMLRASGNAVNLICEGG